MDDARAMSLAESVRDLRQNAEQLVEGRVVIDHRAERLPVDQLHGDVVNDVRGSLCCLSIGRILDSSLTDLVDCHDVRMVERGGGLRLLNETANALGVAQY